MSQRALMGMLTITLLSLAVGGNAQAVTASGDISAEVVTALSLTPTSALDFGQCVTAGRAGKVVLAPNGNRMSFGGVTLGRGVSGAPGSFQVNGTTNATCSITLPSLVRISSGESTMIVDQFTLFQNPSGALDGLGESRFWIGATLNVRANQPRGVYQGSYDVTIVYN